MIYGASHLLRMMLENKVLNQRVTEDMTYGQYAASFWNFQNHILNFALVEVHHRCCQSGSNTWQSQPRDVFLAKH